MQRVSYSASLIYQVSERMVGIIGRQVLVSMIRLLQLFQLAGDVGGGGREEVYAGESNCLEPGEWAYTSGGWVDSLQPKFDHAQTAATATSAALGKQVQVPCTEGEDICLLEANLRVVSSQ